MKVLVTGSEGSLMQAVIPLLLAQGHAVVGVDNFFRYGRIERQRPYQLIEGDLADDFVQKIMTDNVEAIIQGAARIFGVSGFHAYPADILGRDVVLHQNLLWAAKGKKKKPRRIVYISSSMVYERCQSVPSSEDEVDNMQIPFTDYGLSKLVGERLSRAFQKQYGIDFTIWRPFNIITPFEKAEREVGFSHVFADFIENLIVRRENPLKIIGDGEQIRCFTWIGDVAAAIAKFSFDDRTVNQAFNLGNPEPVTMKNVAQLIYQEGQERGVIPAGCKLEFEHLPTFADDVRIRVPSVEKAKNVLGWIPEVKVQQSIQRCVGRAIESMAAAVR